jgi:exonuclease SbcD
MRILHFSDVHIGVENYSRTDPETGLSSRLRDFLDTYDEVVSYALDSRVDLALFCGDAYKSRDPSQTHQREFARRIARLAAAGIPILLLVGNHDMPHVINRATALEIFQTLEVPNVHIADTLKTHVIKTASGPVQVVAVPWFRRSNFLAREETRGMSPEQVNEAIQERLSQAIRAQAEALDVSIPAVLAGHLTVSEARTSSEQSMMLGRDPVLLKSNVALPQFDYVALGHVHRHQILGQSPHVVYSGSLQRIDFGEEKDEKGFCVADLDPARPAGSRLRDFQFRPVKARSFLTIAVNIPDGDPDPTATVAQAISGYHIAGAVVRVAVSVPAELEGRLRDADIRSALAGAHYVAAIHKDTREHSRIRLGQAYSRSLDPRDALKMYLDSRSTPKERADVLMRHAEALMDEAL